MSLVGRKRRFCAVTIFEDLVGVLSQAGKRSLTTQSRYRTLSVLYLVVDYLTVDNPAQRESGNAQGPETAWHTIGSFWLIHGSVVLARNRVFTTIWKILTSMNVG